jgi:hypothetical protein
MSGFPNRYVVFDTETEQARDGREDWETRHRLCFGVAKVYSESGTGDDRPEHVVFREADQFHHVIRTMGRKDDTIWVFAHNVAFDARIVDWFQRISSGDYWLTPPKSAADAGRYKEPFITIDGLPTIMRMWRADGQRLMVIDSMNWFPFSLRELGRRIGHPKGQDPGPDAPNSQRIDYCKNDVDIVDVAIRRLWGWLTTLGMDCWTATPASASKLLFSTRFNKGSIEGCPDPALLALDRHGYYGGDIEVYRHGRYEGMCYEVDVNGLYPAVMRGRDYPLAVESADLSPDARHEPGEIDPSCTTAEVYLDARERSYPIRCADGVFHARGAIRTILPGPELMDAVSRGEVVGVGRYVRFKMGRPFDRFIDSFWRRRVMALRQGDEFTAGLCKSFANSLHGKFGQRDGQWVYQGRRGHYDLFSGGQITGNAAGDHQEYRCLAGHEYYRARDGEHSKGFVPIASWCTSYAREYMRDIGDTVGWEHVLYQCVDSFIVDGIGLGTLQLAGLVDVERLGGFKVKDTYQWVDLKGTNQYEHDHGYHYAGIKAGAVELQGERFEIEEWESLAHSLTSGHIGAVGMRSQVKRVGGRYMRRKVLVGGDTVPWITDNWDLSPEEQADELLRRLGPA